MTVRREGVVERVVDARTASVLVERLVTHAKYGKSYRRSKTYLVDVPQSITLTAGDKVVIVAVRPVSARKHWRVASVTATASTAPTLANPEEVA